MYCKLMAFTEWFYYNLFIYLHKIFIDLIIVFYCSDTFYVDISLFYFIYYIVLRYIFYLRYIAVYVRVGVIGGPLKMTR